MRQKSQADYKKRCAKIHPFFIILSASKYVRAGLQMMHFIRQLYMVYQPDAMQYSHFHSVFVVYFLHRKMAKQTGHKNV